MADKKSMQKPALSQILADTGAVGLTTAVFYSGAKSIYERVSTSDYAGYFDNFFDLDTFILSLGAAGLMFGYHTIKKYKKKEEKQYKR